MNVFARTFSESRITFCDQNPQIAADFIEDSDLPQVIQDLQVILSSTNWNRTKQKLFNRSKLTDIVPNFRDENQLNIYFWVLESRANFVYLMELLLTLHNNFLRAYQTHHPLRSELAATAARYEFIAEGPLTPFPNLAFDERLRVDFRNQQDTCLAYRMLTHARARSQR